jgi:tetratricopeptide (TPR) repeat protein
MDNITWIGTITKGGLCVGKVLTIANNKNLIDSQIQYINREYLNKNYDKCYDSCEYLLNLLPTDKEAQKRIKRFCYTKQAVCLKKTGKYKEALEKADVAEQYCSKDDYYCVVYMKALIYKLMGEKEKAIKCLNQCIKWYKHNNMYYELAKALDTKADLLKDEKLFLESIENYKLAEQEKNYLNEEKFNMEFDNVYHRLADLYIYIGEQNMIKAYQILNNIRGTEARAEVTRKIKDLYRKEV